MAFPRALTYTRINVLAAASISQDSSLYSLFSLNNMAPAVSRLHMVTERLVVHNLFTHVVDARATRNQAHSIEAPRSSYRAWRSICDAIYPRNVRDMFAFRNFPTRTVTSTGRYSFLCSSSVLCSCAHVSTNCVQTFDFEQLLVCIFLGMVE